MGHWEIENTVLIPLFLLVVRLAGETGVKGERGVHRIRMEKGGRKGGRTEGRKDGREDGRKEGRTDGRKEERTDGRREGRTEGRKEGRKKGGKEGRTLGRHGERKGKEKKRGIA